MPRWRNWYTRTTQNRVSQGVRVRLPPEAQNIKTQAYAWVLLYFVATGGSRKAEPGTLWAGEPGSRKISKRNLSVTDSLMLFVPREKQCLRTVSEGVEKVA